MKRIVLILLILPGLLFASLFLLRAQDDEGAGSVIRVEVDLVPLNVAVTDKKGNYVVGLRPQDFVVTEDGISEKIAAFEEGNEIPQVLTADRGGKPATPAAALIPGMEGKNTLVAGASVFILFDTSNYMYRDFASAQDAIANFIRTLDQLDRVAFYSYSRNFSRAVLLTDNRPAVLRGVRDTTAGDAASLYGAMLLTLKDAMQVSGRKVMVVFTDGPDTSSMVGPEEVGELAQSEGIPIYMVSTREAKLDPVSTTVFGRMSSSTGGEAYFAKSWEDEQQAFVSIREDLSHLYSLSYYPQFNSNRGWRAITVKLTGPHAKDYRIRSRSGYRPRPASSSSN